MDGAPLCTKAEHKTAMPARIIRLVFNDRSVIDDLADLPGAYHSGRPQHLPLRMRQKEQLSICGGSHTSNHSSKVSSSLTDVNFPNKTKPLGGVRAIGSCRVERVVMVEMVWPPTLPQAAEATGKRLGPFTNSYRRQIQHPDRSC